MPGPASPPLPLPRLPFPFRPWQEQTGCRAARSLAWPLPLATGNSPHAALAVSPEASSSLLTIRETGCRSGAICLGLELAACGGHLFTGCGEAQSCLRNDLQGSSLGCLATSKQGLVVSCPSRRGGCSARTQISLGGAGKGQGGMKGPRPPVQLTLRLLGIALYSARPSSGSPGPSPDTRTGTLLCEDPASHRDPRPVSAFA